MGWEQRERGGCYYVRKVRVGGKVTSLYMGCGPLANQSARMDARDRETRDRKRAALQKEREELAGREAALCALHADVEAVLRQTLTAAGYHRHDRGAWRKRREDNTVKTTDGEKPFNERNGRSPFIEKTGPGQDMARLAKEGAHNRAAMERYFQALEADGQAERFVDILTDTAGHVLRQQHDDLITQEAFRRKMERLRAELGWESASPLERLLIERIALCGNHLQHLEAQQASGWKQSLELETAGLLEASVARAERRYLLAIKSLAVLRRLSLPAVQINVAEKQVNLLSSGAVPLVQGSETGSPGFESDGTTGGREAGLAPISLASTPRAGVTERSSELLSGSRSLGA